MKLVGYIRVSTDEQAKHFGPALQRAEIEQWSKRAGNDIVAWHMDSGVSGMSKLDDRPELLAAVAYCRRMKLDGLVVWKRDRLTRDPIETAVVEDMLRRGGAKVYSVDGNNDDGPEAGLVRFILDAFSRYEALKIRSRTMGGKKQSVQRGGTWCKAPYGYRKIGRELVVEEETARTVRLIFQLRERGATLEAISRQLNEAGVKPPWIASTAKKGRTYNHDVWSRFCVRAVLDRERFYQGEVNQLGDPIAPGGLSHVPIIGEVHE